MSEVIIYGAGDAGMVAAVNLARAGYEVTVRDQENGIGGSPSFNPSAHTTPMEVDRVSEYVGIDLAPALHHALVAVYVQDTRIDWKKGFYTVERGKREGSLDNLLYAECLKCGVRFEFDTPLRAEDLPGLPPDTIVACGLNPAAYEMLDLPYQRWYGYISRGEIGFSDYCVVWLNECVTEYGYLSTVNNFYFNLLFSIRPVSREALERYETFLARTEGIEHQHWEERSGAVPVARPDNPRLRHRGLILGGTMGGWMDPFAWFGILGSLMSGRVAALAVMDPARAEEEFRRFNRRFALFYKVKQNYYRLQPHHVKVLGASTRILGQQRAQRLNDLALERGVPAAIPGFARFMGFKK
jgi:flavin-dependent dehydrogenase